MTSTQPKRVKMSELARLSGVPAATIKHYLKEGLLPEPDRTHRNMAHYDSALAPRIRRIKELHRTHFLPLRVLAMEDRTPEETVASSIAAVLARSGTGEKRTRAELIAKGMPAEQLDWLRDVGAITPEGSSQSYSGDDLELLRVLGAARRAGISTEMLPVTILRDYVKAIRALVKVEMKLFRRGVMPRANQDELALRTQTAATLSERLVVIVRRKLLLPTLRDFEQKPKKRKRQTRH